MSYIQRLNKYKVSAESQEIELLKNLLVKKSRLRLYKSSIVVTPILVGAVFPSVILPDKKYEDKNLQNILVHEITHMKRGDILVKWLLIFIGAIHWFNPLVYLVRREINKACELACDESVIKRCDVGEKQWYGDTLIAVAADSIRKIPLSITMCEDKKNLRERLNAIMKYKKHSKGTVVIATVSLIILVCSILGFNIVYSIENLYKSNVYADNYFSPQDQKRIKENELREVLRNYDKENIAEAYVFFNETDGEITSAYITIVCPQKKLNLGMQRGIKALVSEEIRLDIKNIHVDYLDMESFISNERVNR